MNGPISYDGIMTQRRIRQLADPPAARTQTPARDELAGKFSSLYVGTPTPS